jgi:hypothetical protein
MQEEKLDLGHGQPDLGKSPGVRQKYLGGILRAPHATRFSTGMPWHARGNAVAYRYDGAATARWFRANVGGRLAAPSVQVAARRSFRRGGSRTALIRNRPRLPGGRFAYRPYDCLTGGVTDATSRPFQALHVPLPVIFSECSAARSGEDRHTAACGARRRARVALQKLL